MADGWLTAKEAADLTGMSRRTLQRHVDAGRLTVETFDGVRHYSEPDCERLLAGPAESDGGAEGQTLAMLLDFVRVLMAPAKQYNDMMAAHCARLEDRCKHLEQRHDDLVTAKEAFIDASHEREMETRMFEAQQKRRDAAVNLAMEKGLPLMFGGKGKSMSKLLESLNETQVQLLLDTDLTTDEQKVILRDLLKSKLETKGGADEPADGSE